METSGNYKKLQLITNMMFNGYSRYGTPSDHVSEDELNTLVDLCERWRRNDKTSSVFVTFSPSNSAVVKMVITKNRLGFILTAGFLKSLLIKSGTSGRFPHEGAAVLKVLDIINTLQELNVDLTETDVTHFNFQCAQPRYGHISATYLSSRFEAKNFNHVLLHSYASYFETKELESMQANFTRWKGSRQLDSKIIWSEVLLCAKSNG
jgi:hypothetical protein